MNFGQVSALDFSGFETSTTQARDILTKKTFGKKAVGNKANASYNHFLHFSQCFLLHQRYKLSLVPPLPVPKQQIVDSSKLKEFANDNFKLYEKDREFSKWVENTVGKGEIARCEQFLLFPQCFQRTCTADT